MTQRTIAQDGRQTVTTLPPAGSSPSTARRIVESVVNAHRLDNVLDEALLLVTELVTNAVVHAGTDIDLRVDAGDKRLRVEVIDRTPGLLHIDSHLPSDQREGGRGLLLLDALAAEWGTRHFSWGKSVWFVLVTQEETADGADGAPRGVGVGVGVDAGATPIRHRDIEWLVGLDAETGVFMLLFLDLSYEEFRKRGQLHTERDLVESIIHGAVKRVRPKAMTVCAAMLGLLPIMWSVGTGSDLMKRIAAPMVGGLVTSFLMELLVYPPIYLLWRRRQLPAQATAQATAP